MTKLIVHLFTFLMLLFSLGAQASSINWAAVWENEVRTNLPKMQPPVDPGIQQAVIAVYEKLNWQPQYVFWENQHNINKLLQIPAMAAQHGLNPADYPIADILRIENDSAREIEVVIELVLLALDLSTGRVNPADMGTSDVKYRRKSGLSRFRIDAIAKLMQEPNVRVLDDLAPRYEDYLMLQQALASGRYQGEQRQKIILSMEKLRWLPDIPPQNNRYLMVNTASNMMTNHDLSLPYSSPIKTQRVITGDYRKDRLTPSMEDEIIDVILNPYWRVATGQNIWKDKVRSLKATYAEGGIAAIKSYLAAGRYDITRSDFTTLVAPESIDWANVNPNGPAQFTFRQRPWDGNAVGTIKFSLGGVGRESLIYLHDTGSRHLFNNNDRNLSSGCIRVHKYAELAEYLVSDQGWSATEIDRMVNLPEQDRKERYISLNGDVKRLPVFTLHMTAQVVNGSVQFYSDNYREDVRLLNVFNRTKRSL